MSHDPSIEPALRAVEPALRLVHERHLRQILNFLIDRGHPLPTNPELPYWIDRTDVAAADVLPWEVLNGTEPRLLLVIDPNDRMIADRPQAEQLRTYWRVLFRAAVMKAIDAKLAAGQLTPAQCHERLTRFGPAAAREIRYVLETEHQAAPEAGPVELYRAFAAAYLDLSHFTGHTVEEFFPALPHGEAVRAALAADVDAELLLKAARPQGAADPERPRPPDEQWSDTAVLAAATASAPTAAPEPSGPLLQKADEAERNGNLVRAALLRTQAAAAAGPDRERASAGALAALALLVERLGDVLDWDAETRQEWRQALVPLLPPAAAGRWPRAARCLYELQKIPADLSREVYAVDLPEYIRTFGRRPVRRHLPHARPVMVVMALRRAHKQLLRSAIGEPEQLRVDRLLHHEIHRREHVIRHEFTPIIVTAISSAGLVPACRAEEVARDKLVAELLDRVCERGYLRIGDLRDAIARNRLKMPDLTGIGEFLRGDPLLRADVNLAYALDGVYRRGEFYLRWIQRFSALFFGTPWGRLLTLYLAVPFGGAFLVLMFAEEMRHLGGKAAALVAKSLQPTKPKPEPEGAAPKPAPKTAPTLSPAEAPPPGDWVWDEEMQDWWWDPNARPPKPPEPPKPIEDRASLVTAAFTSSEPEKKDAHHGSVLIEVPTILGFGVFLLLMFHVPPFRRSVFRLLHYLWLLVRGLLWDLPRAVWWSPPVRAVRQSRPVRFLYRRLITPLVITVLAAGAMFVIGVPLWWLLGWGWAFFAVFAVAYNMPAAWTFRERVAEALADWWRLVRVNLIVGLIATFIDWFRMLANWFERKLYAVDEWMRFRGGDSQGSLALKAVLGLVWFPVAYVFRFGFYLLFEPQVNPVKHFPVVTVGHKVVWPTLPAVAELIGWVPATILINGCPGIFGFIAWELKENWRLYRANRAPRLTPVMVGSHGESMRGMLRPGFHSGTVPKLHRKTRHALAAGDAAKAARLHHEMTHAVEGVQRFAERELVPLLSGCPEWGAVEVEIAAVRFGVQRAEIDIAAPELGRDPLVLGFENVGGVIEAGVANVGWADKLTDSQRAVLVFALRGLLDLGAAARFDGRPRSPEAPDEPTFAALARRVTWDEWAARWGQAQGQNTPAGH